MSKTDYLGIHERAYKRIIEEGRSGWSDNATVQAMVEVVGKGMEEQGVTSGRILELGCGDGSLALALESKGFDVYGIDVVPIAIEWAKTKASSKQSNAEFQVGDVISLPYSNSNFDIVVDASCSHCIIGEDRVKFFAESYRVLKSNGLFVLNCLCEDPSKSLIPYFDSESRCLIKRGIAGRYYGKVKDILKEAEKAGFINLSWKTDESDFGDKELVLYCSKSIGEIDI